MHTVSWVGAIPQSPTFLVKLCIRLFIELVYLDILWIIIFQQKLSKFISQLIIIIIINIR